MSRYLYDRRVKLGLTQKQVADAVGVSEATVSRWEGGQIANMRRDRIALYAKALNTTPNFIMTGEGATLPSPATIPDGFEPLPKMQRVPLVGDIACGDPITAEENIIDYVGVLDGWNADFALRCHGHSMEPKIKDGDIVAIKKQPQVENGQIAAVRIDNEATLKKVYIYPDHILLQPFNPECEPITYYGDEMSRVVIEGRAVGLCRSL